MTAPMTAPPTAAVAWRGKRWARIDNWTGVMHRLGSAQVVLGSDGYQDWAPRVEALPAGALLSTAVDAITGRQGQFMLHEVLSWVPEDQVYAFAEVLGWHESDPIKAIETLGHTLKVLDNAFVKATLADALGWAFVAAGCVRVPGWGLTLSVPLQSATAKFVGTLALDGVASADWPLVAAGMSAAEIVAARTHGSIDIDQALVLAALRGVRLPPG